MMTEPMTSPTAAGAGGPGGKPPRTRGGTASRATPTARFSLPLPAFMRRHNLQLWIGGITLGAMVLLLAIGPLFVTDDPNRQDLLNTFAPSSAAHPLGTDQLGRDVLSRFLHGGRVDLIVSVVAVIVRNFDFNAFFFT